MYFENLKLTNWKEFGNEILTVGLIHNDKDGGYNKSSSNVS